MGYGTSDTDIRKDTDTGSTTTAEILPESSFTATPTSGTAPLTVTFTNTSNLGSGELFDYQWIFGDGDTSSEENPVHIYNTAGEYDVRLKVTTTVGNSTSTEDITVESGAGGGGDAGGGSGDIQEVAPIASFNANLTEIEEHEEVMFTNTSTTGNGEDLTYLWSFGDGSIYEETAFPYSEFVVHEYETAGVYSVTLRVTTTFGQSVSSPISITVNEVPIPPEPSFIFSLDPPEGTAPLMVTFTDETNYGNGDLLSRTWDFGDGNDSAEENPEHEYINAGEYDVVLTIQTTAGTSHAGPETIIALPALIPEYQLTVTNSNLSNGSIVVNEGENQTTVTAEGYYNPELGGSVTIEANVIPGFQVEWSGDVPLDSPINGPILILEMDSDKNIVGDFVPVDIEAFRATKLEVQETVADIFYTKFFVSNTLTDAQVLAVQTTTRGGYKVTGRTEDEPLVFYKKDRNTLESQTDLQTDAINEIVEDVYSNDLLQPDNMETFLSSFILTKGEPYSAAGVVLPRADLLGVDEGTPLQLQDYNITYTGTSDQSVKIATEVVRYEGDAWIPVPNPYFTDALNLSQITKPKTGTKIDPIKAREVLDTDIFELLPTQLIRQDDVDRFFGDFNSLIGQPPIFSDVDGDGVGEQISDGGAADSGSRISEGDTSTAFITRLDSQANILNVDKTLETMRNRLNQYLGDVDNVVEEIQDERPEYENKSGGFLKIRKPNQAIILRDPDGGELEFQKGNSFLTDGFTISQWVRFVGKTGNGTLFSFGNPYATDNRYGFRLETFTEKDNQGDYERFVRLVVWDHTDVDEDHLYGKLHDSHFGMPDFPRVSTPDTPAYEQDSAYKYNHLQIPTDNLDEWYFICATYDPSVTEASADAADYLRNKQFWLGHILPLGDDEVLVDVGMGEIVANDRIEMNNAISDLVGGDLLRMLINMQGAPVQIDGTIDSVNYEERKIYFTSDIFGDNEFFIGQLTEVLKITNLTEEYTAHSGLGAKCKVEAISRTDLLRARGFKVDDFDIPLNSTE